MSKPRWFSEDIVLGWKVTKSLEPEHWGGGKPGKHKPTDLISANPRTIANHTVIVAQSGSGKSFFLGRLVEEILLKTRSRILVLDMNSDFRRVAETKEKEWESPRYNERKRTGFLAEEPSRADFTTRWDPVTKLVYTARIDGHGPQKLLKLDWLKFPVDLLAEDAAEEKRDQLRHCHSLVNVLAGLATAAKNNEWLKEGAFLKRAFEFCNATEGRDEKAVNEALQKEFGDADERFDVLAYSNSIGSRDINYVYLREHNKFPSLKGVLENRPNARQDRTLSYQRVATHRKFVRQDALQFYFGRAFDLVQSGLINPNIQDVLQGGDPCRLEVVDLPSISDSRHQKMAMCTFLEAEWLRARHEWVLALEKPPKDDKRVPLFIVVEEAHNASPEDVQTPTEKKLRELFRRIAAEGRKFGMFLIFVSQRPDKLDRMIMSECQNRAIMRVGSVFVLRTTCDILALDGIVPRMTEKVLDFEVGRALLAGPWVADEPAFLVAAARRTVEGGRDLQSDYWAKIEAP